MRFWPWNANKPKRCSARQYFFQELLQQPDQGYWAGSPMDIPEALLDQVAAKLGTTREGVVYGALS